ncbi:MAG: pyridoxamine 5'-phosphate oxidase family protein [Solirubrobacterales bacterium]|nr:pyridoxamine 5'-phosphate oxidase family protein [Solirubrobacterales bacterium]
MTATLPSRLQDVFERYVTCEYVTIDGRGQPIAWPVTPYYHHGEGCIDVTTGIGYPKKAADAERNPHVALLFSDPTGSGIADPPMVLVQGTAQVDDRDLKANAERYRREAMAKLPGAKDAMPPKLLEGLFGWYFLRLYVHVRPERVFVWPSGRADAEPELYDAHLEEVRSHHNEEPEDGHPDPEGGPLVWDERLDELGANYPTAVLPIVSPDGFPFAVRLPVEPDRAAGVLRFRDVPVGIPLEPGLACVCAHDHDPEFHWQRNFQVRGDLVPEGDGWTLRPHKMVGGFELPPVSALQRYKINARKVVRYRKIAKRELARRGG